MINILIGMLIMAFFFLYLYGAFCLGRKQQKKDKVEQLSKEEKEAVERQIKGLENVLNYDYEIAIGKRVNK